MKVFTTWQDSLFSLIAGGKNLISNGYDAVQSVFI